MPAYRDAPRPRETSATGSKSFTNSYLKRADTTLWSKAVLSLTCRQMPKYQHNM
jgi:hypothetical protein